MRFIESILFKDGVYKNLSIHQERMDDVFKKYAPGNNSHALIRILPDLKMEGTYKVRLVYDMDTEDVEYDIEFAEYQPRQIKTLQVVHSKPFDYSMKFEDRTKINKLVKSSNADDIIIAIDNHITDGSYFNLAFWNGVEWLTPDTPLLKGVKRTQLMQEGKIKETTIQISDLNAFEKVSLINAMIGLGELELPISAIEIPKTGG
ncbi:4-amino-4-deoxychorismate lyase [Ekhidna lutea]|uniref:4-amino-4-deoxychorismate lyase n=1 Tax=Ekhidna lutea TaxID=447679 RepID=A0A239IXG2_EKHLU|nr:aminotransferase class IV [Ekhidna lutea]SNS97908.1 4-amino-4-deoxychorismate lyase [Ekhidna lutea]